MDTCVFVGEAAMPRAPQEEPRRTSRPRLRYPQATGCLRAACGRLQNAPERGCAISKNPRPKLTSTFNLPTSTYQQPSLQYCGSTPKQCFTRYCDCHPIIVMVTVSTLKNPNTPPVSGACIVKLSHSIVRSRDDCSYSTGEHPLAGGRGSGQRISAS
jgi:hypothetical protein